MVIPNCPFYNVGAKLSVFTMLVPNRPFSYLSAKLSGCLLGAKLSVFTTLVPNCPVPNCPGAKLSSVKLSYHPSQAWGRSLHQCTCSMPFFSINHEIMIFSANANWVLFLLAAFLILCCVLLLLKWKTKNLVPRHFHFLGRNGSSYLRKSPGRDGSGTVIQSGPGLEERLHDFQIWFG